MDKKLGIDLQSGTLWFEWQESGYMKVTYCDKNEQWTNLGSTHDYRFSEVVHWLLKILLPANYGY